MTDRATIDKIRESAVADPSAEIERLHRLVDAYRLAAVNAGWSWPMVRAYGHEQYLHDQIVAVDAAARRTIASGYDAAAYLCDGLAGGSK